MLRRQSIGTIVALGFASLLVMLGGMVALAIHEVDVSQRQRRAVSERLRAAEAVDQLGLSIARAHSAFRAHLLNPSRQDLDRARYFREQARLAAAALTLSEQADAEEQRLAQQVRQATEAFLVQAGEAERFAPDTGRDNALTYERHYLGPAVEAALDAVQALRAQLTTRAATVRRQLAHRGDRLTQWLVMGFGLAGIVGVLLGIHFVRLVTDPVERLAAAARAVEAGDYSRARRLGGAAPAAPAAPEAPPVENEIALLERSFAHMARALEEREQELRTRTESLTAANRHLAALQSLTDVALSDLSLDPLLQQLLERVVTGLGADAGAILLLDSSTGRLEPRAQVGIDPNEAGREGWTFASGFPEAVAAAGRLLAVPDVRTDARFEAAAATAGRARSLLALPLRLGEQLLGIAYVGFGTPPPFAPPELQLMELFGDRVERAVERARVLAELERWNRELEQRVAAQQERLLWSERLAAIGLLGGSIAHELRNPLGVISNAVYFLRHRSRSPDEKAQRHLEIIELEVAQAARIINNLVDFSNSVEPVTTRLDLNEIIHAALDRARLPAGIRLELHLDRGLPGLLGDEAQIIQVFEHLIRNAVQAMDGAGVLRIGTSSDGAVVRAAVQDSGPGVPPEHQERIFEPLFSTRTKGMGLGLSLARKILQAHGGEIRLVGAPGPGARFIVELPVTDRLPVPEEAEETEAAAQTSSG